MALTLRSLAGLTTPEIARAFLVPHETMAKRLTRAKRKITEARIPYRVPAAHLLGERLRAVLAVIYALFNEGYGASAGDELIRKDLCVEAIRLGRLLAELMPDEPEALGLLSLMLLQDSRRAARLDTDGELVTLEDQNRSLWDRAAIAEACTLLDRAVRLRRPGPYQLQAAIARLPRARRHLGGDGLGRDRRPVPAVERDRPDPGGAAEPCGRGRHGRRAGVRVDARRRARPVRSAGRLLPVCRRPAPICSDASAATPRPTTAYRRALELAPTDAERRFLRRRLSELSARTLPLRCPFEPCARSSKRQTPR